MDTVPPKTKYLNLNGKEKRKQSQNLNFLEHGTRSNILAFVSSLFADPTSFTFPSPTPLPSGYLIKAALPSPETYISLRVKSGLSSFPIESAIKGLPNSTFACSIIHEETNSTIGMGRIVGDGGCFLLIVDIAVLPEHQKKGLGKVIMENLLGWIKENAKGVFVTLLADGKAKHLYARYGFKETGPYSLGMGVIA